VKYRVQFARREEGFVVADESCLLVEEWEVWLGGERVVATCESETDARMLAELLEEAADRAVLAIRSSGEVAAAVSATVAAFSATAAAYSVGYEQGRLGAEAEARSVAYVPEAPRECFSREAWRALSDVEKVDALLRRIDADQHLASVSRLLVAMPGIGRRSVVESIGSVFCTGCGDIQGIDEHGHLDDCQCQNDE
jgi:hypothetical protein